MPRKGLANKRTTDLTARGHSVSEGSKVDDLSYKPDSFIECRIHHAWVLDGWFYWNDISGAAIAHTSSCSRCGTTKDVYHRADGSVMDTRYDYPDGYALHGDGRVRRADVFLEAISRSKVYATPETMQQARRQRQGRLKIV